MYPHALCAVACALLLVAACEKNESPAEVLPNQPQAQPMNPAMAPGAPAPAGQPTAQAPAADREQVSKDMQGRLDTLTAKMDALRQKATAPANKANKPLQDGIVELTNKLEAARTDVKALMGVSDANWGEARAKMDSNLKEIEVSLEQATSRAIN